MYAFSTIGNYKFETQVIFGNCTVIPLNWVLLCSIQTNNNLKIKRDKERKKMPLNQKRLRWTFPHSNQIRNCCRHRCRNFFSLASFRLLLRQMPKKALGTKSTWKFDVNAKQLFEMKRIHKTQINKRKNYTNERKKTIWEKIWVEKRLNIKKMRPLKKRRRKNGEFIRKEMNDCS